MKKDELARGQVARFFRIVLPASIVLITGCLALLGFLTYRITHPGAVQEPVNPSHYLLPALDVSWSTQGGFEVTGWWIPGIKGASVILLAPGYGMSRSDPLSLAASLHNVGYHVLIYAQRGSGISPRGASSLGLHETEDMESALAYLKLRPGVNPKRLGIWGVDEGARAALAVAASHPEVHAIAADAPYENIMDFFVLKVREESGYSNWLIENGCREIFRLCHLGSFKAVSEPLSVGALSDRNILFIQGANRKDMAPLTVSLYDRVHPQKEMISLPVSRVRLMTGEELSNYDRQVSNFFHLNLVNDIDR